MSAHAPVGNLCTEPHTCPACEAEEPCQDLFMHATCGLVACTKGT